jgi:hypothetical protein
MCIIREVFGSPREVGKSHRHISIPTLRCALAPIDLVDRAV